jgi:hypothetical protein
MTDAGEFERLATAVLRRADARYAALVHSGVNAKGRPVKSPVDGFRLAGGEGAPQVFVAHTTMAHSALSGKWLHPEDGDIAKAAATARRVGAQDVRLVLTLNREPSLDLVAAAKASCDVAGLQLDVWPQSRLADFLDDDPEGQWIRRRFFGTLETRISFSSLRADGEAGPTDIVLFDPPAALMPRATSGEVAAKLFDGQRLVLLNSASGQGKTVVTTQVWRRMVVEGAAAIHVTHEDVDVSASLAEALSRALRRRAAGRSEACGHEAIELAGTYEILVLVEDINRSERPLAALQKVVSWAHQASVPGFRMLCPIWPRALAGLSEPERKAVAGSVMWLDLPSDAEAMTIAGAHAAAQGCSPDPHDLFTLVQRLGRDPLLLGLHDYREATSDGVRAYVAREAARVASRAGLVGADLLDALDVLAQGMLQARSLEPGWRDVRTLVDGEQANWLVRLLDAGTLLRFGGEGCDERIVFRHDRVRDQIRASGLRRLLERDSNDEVLSEPAYAELWGLLLADPETPGAWIERASVLSPLALFQGIAACGSAASERRVALAAAAADWLRRGGAGTERFNHLRWAAQFALADVEAPEVPELLPLFAETTWMTREAAFLNGDMLAGLNITVSWDPFRLVGREKRLFDHVRAKRAGEARDFIAAGLRDATASPDRICALLGMAGRMRDPSLEPVLVEAWDSGPRAPDFIHGMLWALALCAPCRLGPVFDAWAELSEEGGEHGRTPRSNVGYDARAGLWELAGKDALAHFLERARDDEGPLAWYLGNILEGWDDPDAQERYVRQLAWRLARSRETGGNGLVGAHIGEIWSEDTFRGGRVMSEASLRCLQGLWSDTAENEDVRTVALRLWSHAARPKHLAAIRTFEGPDPLGPLGAGAVRALLLLNDPGGADALGRLTEADPEEGWLWQHVRGRWNEAFLPVLEHALDQRRALKAEGQLGRFRADYVLSDVMLWMDDTERTRLLSEHWDHLGDNYNWVRLALWTATPKALALARQSLDAGNPRELLRHISMHYGLYSNSDPATTELRRLQALEPWLDHLDDLAFQQLEEHCNRLGWRDWRRAHIDDRLPVGGRGSQRTSTSRRAEFDRIADQREPPPYVRIHLEHMVQAEGDANIVLAELDAWLTERRDLAALRVACAFVVEVAARSELLRLEGWRSLAILGGDEVVDDYVFALKRRTLR